MSEIVAGIAAALAGSGLIAAGPIIVAAGAALCATGSAIISFAVFVTGLGILVGVLNRSAEAVRASLVIGGIAGAAGVTLVTAGIAMKIAGYVCICTGAGLVLGGVCMTAHAIRKIRNPEKRAIAESVRASVDGLKNRHLGEGLEQQPIVIVDLTEVRNR